MRPGSQIRRRGASQIAEGPRQRRGDGHFACAAKAGLAGQKQDEGGTETDFRLGEPEALNRFPICA
jgi:hypothetical protein